ncbi:MAG TPA: PEGA domain-containing protein [Gemmatimonadaceae bacterium]|nr:PEGA domain-containing protein [Gemmatimonadaceae bacterium]
MLHQVGVGALGPVFRTYEPTRDRLVAVKVFRLDITPEQAQALADELGRPAEAGLFHPSIVEPIGAGVEGSSAYRADEYVAAETLDVAMRHYAPAPIDKVLPYITQLAGAVDFARTAGVTHGALHPRDIFITPEEARAGGFGVVEALERVGLRAPVRRPYTAPERIAGEAWGAPADVFSLAVIAYELLTGRRPSGTGNQIGSVTGGEHAAAIHAVFVRALADDPAQRYQSALAFAAALDAAARGEGVPASVPAAGAAAGAVTTPFDSEDAVDDMPPRVDVDERTEPAEVEQEESEFRASEPEFDEIAAEDEIAAGHDEDDRFAALPTDVAADEEPRYAAAADRRSLFDRDDDEIVDEFASETPSRHDTERFADEFAAAAHAVDEQPIVRPEKRAPKVVAYDVEDVPPAPSFAGYSSEPVVHERRGPGLAMVVVTVGLALLVGFAAGYAVGGRVPLTSSSGETAATTGTATGEQAPAATPKPQPYSEGTVTPSQTPPPVATEPPQPVSESPANTAAAPTKPSDVLKEPAAPPAPVTGTLQVRSTPSNAAVTVNGEWTGRTPLTIDKLPFGRHEIRVVQDGYAVEREQVTLSASRPMRTLSYRLRRTAPAKPSASKPAPAKPSSRAEIPPVSQTFTGVMYVDSRPRGARVLVDGKFMGTTPVRIPDLRIGSHVVRLQLADHGDWTTSTRVSAGQETRVTGSLERIR